MLHCHHHKNFAGNKEVNFKGYNGSYLWCYRLTLSPLLGSSSVATFVTEIGSG